MNIQLQINESKAEFFLEYLNSLKDGIVEKIEIANEPKYSFMISDKNEVKKRIANAEQRADYQEHDDFWKELKTK
jgi:hypothetical protein